MGRLRAALAAALLGVAGLAQAVDTYYVENPSLAWPGNRRTPMREMECFAIADYSKCTWIVRRIRAGQGRANGLTDFTLSLWVRVPLRPGVTYPVARFNAVAGNGAATHYTHLLEIAPSGNGHVLLFRKDGDYPGPGVHLLSAPFPRTLANRWNHIILSMPQFESWVTSNIPPQTEGTLVLNGRAFPGKVWNDLESEGLDFLGLGGPGVAIANAALYEFPLTKDGLTLEALAKQTFEEPRGRREGPPQPAYRNTFDDRSAFYSSERLPISLSSDSRAGGERYVSTPNNKGTSVSYHTLASQQKKPIAIGDAWAIGLVGKFSPAEGAILYGQGVGDNPTRDWFGLRSAGGGVVEVVFEVQGRTLSAPIRALIPDAATAFHHYLLNYGDGFLELWVDGRPIARAKVSPATTPYAHEPRTPYLACPHRLTLTALQFGKRFGDVGRTVADGKHVIDDFALYGRTLTGKEIREVSESFRITGRPARQAPAGAGASKPTATSAPAVQPAAGASGDGISAETPILEWPGAEEPLAGEAIFDRGDYSVAFGRGIFRVRQSGGDWSGLTAFTFSTWVRVPLQRGASYPVARFNSAPGGGMHGNHTTALDIVPDGSGFALRLVRPGSRQQPQGFRVPFPADRANRWTHIVFSVPNLPMSGSPLLTPGTLAVNGQSAEGTFHNEHTVGTLANVALGGKGVAIGPTQIFKAPLGGDLTVAALAKRSPRRATALAAAPRPAYHWTFGYEKPDCWSWDHRLMAGSEGTRREHIPAKNGEGSAVCYYSFPLGWKYPLLTGPASTVVAVGRFAPTPGSTLLSLCIGNSPNWQTHHINLRTAPNDGGTVTLAADWAGAMAAPIAVKVPDAATALHCYAIRFEAGTLSLWVDGRLAGQAPFATFPLPEAKAFPYLKDARHLNVFGFQVGKVFNSPGNVRDFDFMMDDLAFYGRALTPAEIATLAAKLNCAPGPGTPAAQAATAPAVAPAVAPAASAATRAALPILTPGAALPDAAALKEAEAMLDEILAGTQPSGAELLGFVKDAASDAGRYATLRRAEAAFIREKAFADALFVLQARAAAFPDSLEDDQLEALSKGTLRAHAATKPDTALGDLTALLAYAQGQRRAKAVKAIIRQANLSTRHLLKAKTYDAWRAAAENAETALDAAANLATLRERAKSGAPTANKALALALIKANRWDAATLEACTRSGDAALADPAKAETANEPIEAGNGWWEAADACAEADPALAKALRARAVARYRQGVHTLTGLRARLIQKRIDEAD